MPYKDKAKQLQKQAEWVRQKRGKGAVEPGVTSLNVEPFSVNATSDVEPDVEPQNLLPDIRALPPEWAHVAEFISRPLAPGQTLANLEKLKRLAGALGKYADDVWFGGLTMGEIGRVLGTEKPELEKKRPY